MFACVHGESIDVEEGDGEMTILPIFEPLPVEGCPTICTMEYNPICGFRYNQFEEILEFASFGNGCGLGIQNCQYPTMSKICPYLLYES